MAGPPLQRPQLPDLGLGCVCNQNLIAANQFESTSDSQIRPAKGFMPRVGLVLVYPGDHRLLPPWLAALLRQFRHRVG